MNRIFDTGIAVVVVVLTAARLSQAQAQERRPGAPPPAPGAERRIALVVGNNAYPRAPLRNDVDDARAVADVLRDSGFEVTVATDTTLRDLDRAVSRFASSVRPTVEGLRD